MSREPVGGALLFICCVAAGDAAAPATCDERGERDKLPRPTFGAVTALDSNGAPACACDSLSATIATCFHCDSSARNCDMRSTIHSANALRMPPAMEASRRPSNRASTNRFSDLVRLSKSITKLL